MYKVKEIGWQEIRLIWEIELWPNKKNGVAKTNEWTWKWTDDFLDYDLLAEPALHHRYDKTRYGLFGGMSLKSKKADKILREKVTTEYWRTRIDIGTDYNEDVITNDMLTHYKGWEWNDIFSKWHSREPDYSAFGFHKSRPEQNYNELLTYEEKEIRA